MSSRIAMLLDNSFRPDLRVLREAETLIGMGHQVTIYAWDRDIEINRPALEILKDIEVVRIAVKSKQQLGMRQIPYYLAYGWRVFWLVMCNQFDIVHCHDLPNLPIGVLLKVFKRIQLVYDAHEIHSIMEAKKYPKFVLWTIRSVEFFLLRWVDRLITVGPKRAKYYHDHYRERIFIAGNWYKARNKDQELGKKYRKDLGIPPDAFVVSFSGTLSPIRCIDILVECASLFANDKKPIYIIIAGKGVLESKLSNLSGIHDHLRYVGWLEDLSPLFSASDAIVYIMDLSHPYSDYNSPNNLYLSIAWSIPLIGVNAGEIGEILRSGENGILLNDVRVESVKDAIELLYETPELRYNIAINLRKLQGQYSEEEFNKALYEAYRSITQTDSNTPTSLSSCPNRG